MCLVVVVEAGHLADPSAEIHPVLCIFHHVAADEHAEDKSLALFRYLAECETGRRECRHRGVSDIEVLVGDAPEHSRDDELHSGSSLETPISLYCVK